MTPPDRTLALWCPDWSFVAAGLDPTATPAVTIRAGRVAACSHAAREDGVRRGMRRREAQSRSTTVQVLDDDPARDARAFEPVVACVADLVPSVEIVRPGLCAILVRRAARYFGGETRLGTRLVGEIHARTGISAEAGTADSLFAATLAARQGIVVPAHGSAAFLAGFPIGVLDRPELAGLLSRLGIHTLGALAALPAGEVHTRFGAEGAWAHRLASGAEARVRNAHVAAAELVVESVLDPPVNRVDAAAFVARSLAEELHALLTLHGLTCLRVAVEAETENGEFLQRVWRHDGTLSATALADRVRWQLDGWLSGTVAAGSDRPTSGLVVLRLVPDQLVVADGRQLDLLESGRAGAYDTADRADRVDRALTRVQGLLGHDAVVTAVLTGGRDPAEQVRLVPWTDPRPRTARDPAAVDRPWPGRLPDPAPATVLAERLPAEVRDAAGAPVGVSGRATVTASPAQVSVAGAPWIDVVAWAGPWPADTRWWDPVGRRRRARFQLVTADGAARLLTVEHNTWWIDALYD